MEHLHWLSQQLQAVAGDNLVSLTLFDPRHTGDEASDSSQLIVLLRDTSAAALAHLRDTFRESMRRSPLRPYILDAQDPPRMADALPLKALMFRLRGEAVYGTNPFAEIEVDAQHVRLRAEQEVRNLLIRLRHDVALAPSESRLLNTGIWRTKLGVERVLEGIFYTQNSKEAHPDDLWTYAAEHWDLPRTSVASLAAYGTTGDNQISLDIAAKALDALNALVHRIDRMEC